MAYIQCAYAYALSDLTIEKTLSHILYTCEVSLLKDIRTQTRNDLTAFNVNVEDDDFTENLVVREFFEVL